MAHAEGHHHVATVCFVMQGAGAMGLKYNHDTIYIMKYCRNELNEMLLYKIHDSMVQYGEISRLIKRQRNYVQDMLRNRIAFKGVKKDKKKLFLTDPAVRIWY